MDSIEFYEFFTLFNIFFTTFQQVKTNNGHF